MGRKTLAHAGNGGHGADLIRHQIRSDWERGVGRLIGVVLMHCHDGCLCCGSCKRVYGLLWLCVCERCGSGRHVC